MCGSLLVTLCLYLPLISEGQDGKDRFTWVGSALLRKKDPVVGISF